MRTIPEFIDDVFVAYGSGGRLAEHLRRFVPPDQAGELPVTYVSQWRYRGCPSRWRLLFAAAAHARGVEVPDGFLPVGLSMDHVRQILPAPVDPATAVPVTAGTEAA